MEPRKSFLAPGTLGIETVIGRELVRLLLLRFATVLVKLCPLILFPSAESLGMLCTEINKTQRRDVSAFLAKVVAILTLLVPERGTKKIDKQGNNQPQWNLKRK